MCNGSGAEQDRTGMNWLRKELYPTEESHGETFGTPFLCLRLGRQHRDLTIYCLFPRFF